MTDATQDPPGDDLQKVLQQLDRLETLLKDLASEVLSGRSSRRGRSSGASASGRGRERMESTGGLSLWGNTRLMNLDVLQDKASGAFILRPRTPGSRGPTSDEDCTSDGDCGTDGDCGSDCFRDCGADCFRDCGSDCFRDCGADCFRDCGSDCFRDCGSDCFRDNASDCFRDCGADCFRDCGTDCFRDCGANCFRDSGARGPRRPIDEISRRISNIERFLNRGGDRDRRSR